MRQMSAQDIDYYFIRITSCTDQMIEIFKSLYDKGTKELRQINLGENVAALMPTVIDCVTTSVTTSVTRAK